MHVDHVANPCQTAVESNLERLRCCCDDTPDAHRYLPGPGANSGLGFELLPASHAGELDGARSRREQPDDLCSVFSRAGGVCPAGAAGRPGD